MKPALFIKYTTYHFIFRAICDIMIDKNSLLHEVPPENAECTRYPCTHRTRYPAYLAPGTPAYLAPGAPAHLAPSTHAHLASGDAVLHFSARRERLKMAATYLQQGKRQSMPKQNRGICNVL